MNKNSKRKAALASRELRASGGGANINSSAERLTGVTRSGQPRKPWRGGGDPLKRGKVEYNFRTPDPYESRQAPAFMRATPSELRFIAQLKGDKPKPLAQREVVDLIGANKKHKAVQS